MMIKVIRYSKNGFKPQKQTNHMQDVYYHLNGGFDKDFNDFPEHLKYEIEKKHNQLVPFYKKHIENLQEGIWVFIDGYKNNQSLNHLKELVPCWEAGLPEETLVYDVNWEYTLKLKDEEVKLFGCYIPKKELKHLQNIKRRRK